MNYKTKRDYFIRVKNSRGHYSHVVRERYLKDEIPCRTSICSSCIQGTVVVVNDFIYSRLPMVNFTCYFHCAGTSAKGFYSDLKTADNFITFFSTDKIS